MQLRPLGFLLNFRWRIVSLCRLVAPSASGCVNERSKEILLFNSPVVVLSGLFFLLLFHRISCYFCMISIICISLAFKAFHFFSVFCYVAMTKTLLPIRRSMNCSLFRLPVPIRTNVKLVVWKIIQWKLHERNREGGLLEVTFPRSPGTQLIRAGDREFDWRVLK